MGEGIGADIAKARGIGFFANASRIGDDEEDAFEF